MADSMLLEEFIVALFRLNSPLLFYGSPAEFPQELDDGRDDSQWATQKWKPAKISTPAPKLEELYELIPYKIPPLYEQLISSYRWLGIEFGEFASLLPNPPGPDFHSLFTAMTSDRIMTPVLFQNGLLPFGRQCGGGYDPVCFDTRSRQRDGDCPVVRLEHEEILCHQKIGKSWQIFDSFRSFVHAVIQKQPSSPIHELVTDMRGTATEGLTTNQIMKLTRGE